jgi:hypothetical protein
MQNKLMSVSVGQNPVTLEMATSLELRSSSGRIVGTRLVYSDKSAKELREAGKRAGLKGKALQEHVNNVLNGSRDTRWAMHDLAMRKMERDGYVPDATDFRSKSGVSKFVKVGARPTAEQARNVIAAMSPEEKLEFFKSIGLEVPATPDAAIEIASSVK